MIDKWPVTPNRVAGFFVQPIITNMKARTHIYNGSNHCEIYFVYEDYCGFCFRSWEELKRKGEKPFQLVGYLKSHYWGCNEPIDIMDLHQKPTTAEVKQFIANCKKIIDES